MGKIKQLREDPLIKGGSKEPVYPITKARATYTDDNKTVQKVVEEIKTGEYLNDKSIKNRHLGDNSVDGRTLGNLVVDTLHIKNNAVITNKIADSAVTTEKLKGAAVTTEKINDRAINTSKLADNSVTTEKIFLSAVTNAKIANSSITTNKIADKAVTDAKIADKTITLDKLEKKLQENIAAVIGQPEYLLDKIERVDNELTDLTDRIDNFSALEIKVNESIEGTNVQEILDSHSLYFNDLLDSINSLTANDISYDNSLSGILSDNTQDAISELNSNLNNLTRTVDDNFNSLNDSVSENKENLDEVTLKLNTHENNSSNPHKVTKSQVGLGNVTNDALVKRSEMGVTSGVATLDENGLIPANQLPSFVDDILEYDSKDNFPITGKTGKIYVSTDTNLTYRWSGTQYIEISASLALGETSSTAYAGNKGKDVADKLSKLRNTELSHIKDTDTFSATAEKVIFNYDCYVGDLYGNAATPHSAEIPAVSSTQAGIMTATDKQTFDEINDTVYPIELSLVGSSNSTTGWSFKYKITYKGEPFIGDKAELVIKTANNETITYNDLSDSGTIILNKLSSSITATLTVEATGHTSLSISIKKYALYVVNSDSDVVTTDNIETLINKSKVYEIDKLSKVNISVNIDSLLRYILFFIPAVVAPLYITMDNLPVSLTDYSSFVTSYGNVAYLTTANVLNYGTYNVWASLL